MNLFKKFFGGKVEKKWQEFTSPAGESWFHSIFSPRSAWKSAYLNLYKWWVYSAVTKVSESTSGLPIQVLNSEGKKSADKDSKLMTHRLIENVVSYLKLTWTAYVRKIKIWKTVTRLECLRTDKVMIDYESDNCTPKLFRYDVRWSQFAYKPEEILIIADFNPHLPDKWNVIWYWVLNSIVEQLEIEKSILGWNRDFFENDWTPWMFFKTNDDVSPETQKKYIESWKQNYTWKGNKHKIAFLDKWMEMNNLSPIQKDIDFVEQRKFTKDEILSAFWVPQALLGLAEWVNVWNVKAFEEIFYKNTIFPLCRKIEEAINADGDLFKKGTFRFVKDFVLDMDELRADYLAGLLTLNEVRAKKGFPEIENWDVVFSKPQAVEKEIHKQENEKVPDWKRKDEK